MDTPPVIPYPDAAVLAPLADGVVLVVQAESTRGQVVAEAERILRRAGGRPLGAVLNRRRHHIPAWLYGRL
jgi:Mrp family chromosome partitioning ATPase